MKIIETIELNENITVEMEATTLSGLRPCGVLITLHVGEEETRLLTVDARATSHEEAGDAALAELERWLGKLTAVHETAVRMRRMLTKGG